MKMGDMSGLFSGLCMLFDSIEGNSKPGMKRTKLRKFLNEFYQGPDYYPAMRLILPALDKERNSYGMKQQALAKCLVDALGLAKDSPDALKLVGWRDGGKKNGKNTGNFVLVAVEVLKRRQSETSFGLTLEDANRLLDRLAAAEKQENIMVVREMINKTSWKEMKWMLSIILKDLHLGLGEKAVFADFHPDAEHLYNMTMDLKGVCEKLHDRSKRLERQDLTVGAVARPQLASRIPNVEQAWKKMRGKPVVIECKFDGDRLQLHKDGTKLLYFSRNGNDHQEFHHGTKDVLIKNIVPEKCILDGEMCVWSTSESKFLPFGANQEVAKQHVEDPDKQLCYVVFDILYVGEGSVLHCPLSERHELLRKAVRPVPGRLELVLPTPGRGINEHRQPGEPLWSMIVENMEDMSRFFIETVENREEGVVIKDLSSKWEPNDRSAKWLKIKPDYLNTGSDLDVLVIGGYFGTGRNGGQISQFLLGVAEKSVPDALPTKFLSFARVGTGWTDDELEILRKKLGPYLRPNEKGSRPPSCHSVTNHSKERPHLWVVPPEKSVIFEVKSDIRCIESLVFKSPYSLRFPRCERIRYDKEWYECLSVQELNQLVEEGKGSLMDTSKFIALHDTHKRAKRPKPETVTLQLLPSHLQMTDASRVTRTSSIFKGLLFYFVNFSEEYPKERIHTIVFEHGGEVSMNWSDHVTHTIASMKSGVKYLSAMRKGDVIHFQWILDCRDEKALLPIRPRHYLYLSQKTRDEKKEEMDAYGDSYFEDIDRKDLIQCFANLTAGSSKEVSKDLVDHYRSKYCPTKNWCLFGGANIYVHKPIHSTNRDSQAVAACTLERLKLEIGWHSGKTSEGLSPPTTHVIIFVPPDRQLSFTNIAKSFPSDLRPLLSSHKRHVVGHNWVQDTIHYNRRAAENEYEIRDKKDIHHEEEEPAPAIHHQEVEIAAAGSETGEVLAGKKEQSHKKMDGLGSAAVDAADSGARPAGQRKRGRALNSGNQDDDYIPSTNNSRSRSKTKVRRYAEAEGTEVVRKSRSRRRREFGTGAGGRECAEEEETGGAKERSLLTQKPGDAPSHCSTFKRETQTKSPEVPGGRRVAETNTNSMDGKTGDESWCEEEVEEPEDDPVSMMIAGLMPKAWKPNQSRRSKDTTQALAQPSQRKDTDEALVLTTTILQGKEKQSPHGLVVPGFQNPMPKSRSPKELRDHCFAQQQPAAKTAAQMTDFSREDIINTIRSKGLDDIPSWRPTDMEWRDSDSSTKGRTEARLMTASAGRVRPGAADTSSIRMCSGREIAGPGGVNGAQPLNPVCDGSSKFTWSKSPERKEEALGEAAVPAREPPKLRDDFGSGKGGIAARVPEPSSEHPKYQQLARTTGGVPAAEAPEAGPRIGPKAEAAAPIIGPKRVSCMAMVKELLERDRKFRGTGTNV